MVREIGRLPINVRFFWRFKCTVRIGLPSLYGVSPEYCVQQTECPGFGRVCVSACLGFKPGLLFVGTVDTIRSFSITSVISVSVAKVRGRYNFMFSFIKM